MNRTVTRRALPWLLALLILCPLTACDRGIDPADTASPTDEVTSTVGDPVETPEDSESGAESPTESPTETPTETPTEDETQPPEADDGTIRFAVLSDVHIGKSNLPTDPADKFAAALDTVHRVMGTPDAIVIAGDLTDLGTDAQYQAFNTVLWDHVPGDTAVCTVMGNHEYFRDGVVRFGGESAAFIKECQDAYRGVLGELHTDTLVNGMHIIGVSPLSSAADYTAATDFLCEHVRAAAEENPVMPIIVFSHEGFGSLHATGGGRFGAELDKLMREYPQIIAFSGHTHYALNDPRMIRQSLITSIQTSTVGADFWNYSGMDPAQPEGRETASQGLFVEVSPDRVVTVTRYDFTNDTAIGEAWVIDVPAVVESREAFAYTDARKDAAKAPVFPANAKAEVRGITSYTATLTFPAATVEDTVSDGCITAYCVEAKDRESGAVYFSKSFPADSHMGNAAKEQLTVELTGLEHGVDYTLTVTAESAWGKVSQPLTVNFSTPKDESAAPEQMPDRLLHVDYTTGSPADTVSGLTMETFGTPVLKDGMAVLDKESVYGYHLTDKEYAALTNQVSIEATVYIDRDQTYPWGYVMIVGNAEAGGYDIAVVNGKGMQFEVNIGGTYKQVVVPTPFGRWVHIIASYDGQNLRIYLDGELAASTPCSGSIKHVGEKSRKLMVGADVNQDGVPQCISNIKITKVSLYAGGISAEQAAVLFAEAEVPTA